MTSFHKRLLIALIGTILVASVFAFQAISGDDSGSDIRDDPSDEQHDEGGESASDEGDTETDSEALATTTTTTIDVNPNWLAKGSSRYSDRRPTVTVTTIHQTTTTQPDDEER